MKRKLYVNEERTIFVEFWTPEPGEVAGEIVQVAQREAPDRVWGPPTRLTLETDG